MKNWLSGLAVAMLAGIALFSVTWGQTQNPTRGPRVKLVIPGSEPLYIDTEVSGDVTLVLTPDLSGVHVKSNSVDMTLRRGSQQGTLAIGSSMGGEFQMSGEFRWVRENRAVLVAAVGGAAANPTTQPPASPSAARQPVPQQPQAAPQTQPIKIVNQPVPPAPPQAQPKPAPKQPVDPGDPPK